MLPDSKGLYTIARKTKTTKKHAPTYMTGVDKHKQELHLADQITT